MDKISLILYWREITLKTIKEKKSKVKDKINLKNYLFKNTRYKEIKSLILWMRIRKEEICEGI
jgi:hypothetical protein